MPIVSNRYLVANSILDLIGWTPIIKLSRISRAFNVHNEIYAKLEYYNPGGSVKDRIGLYMIKNAEKEGLIENGAVIIEPTSGNTGIGLALVAMIRGYRLIAVMPTKMSLEKECVLKALGAWIVRTPTAVSPENPLSYYNVAVAIRNLIWSLRNKPHEFQIREIVSTIQKWIDNGDTSNLEKAIRMNVDPTPYAYIPNQYANRYNPIAHEEMTAREIWRQMDGRVDYIFAGMGTGGTITGIARFFRKIMANTKIIGVDPEGSIYNLIKRGIPVDKAKQFARPYKVEGIGEDILPETIDLELIDEVIKVRDNEAFSMARYLARVEGVLAGGSSGAVLYATIKYLKEKKLRGKRVLVIFPDTGRNYLTKFYNDDWMKKNGFTVNDEEVLSSLMR